MERKKTIFLCSEASYLSTGFSTYALEILKRLQATGKYDLIEYATYGDPDDVRAASVPWKFIPVKPSRRDTKALEQYHREAINQFGCWKFEEALCATRPDIVWTYRDWWMDRHVETSPFRPYYHWATMPTVDAVPIDEWWLATYMNADSVFAYSDWCLQALNQQGNGRIKTVCSAPPGADFDTIFPVPNKRAHGQSMGLPADALVIGTVMRNQPRKLYPDLIKSFSRFLEIAPESIRKRTFLYLHLRYPDLGWDIPRLIKEAGIGHRTLFTYFCQNCGICFPSFYMDAHAYCRACGSYKARLPGSDHGVPRSVLNCIYNFFDVYVQYANSESFGMPMAEAAAAAVPIMAVDYSAMSDIVRKLHGIPIRVKAMVKEHEMDCERAVPDNEDFVNKLITFLLLPDGLRRVAGQQALRACREHYHYDKTAKIWEEHFDSLPVAGKKWEGPPRLHHPAMPQLSRELTHAEWVRLGLTHLAGRPDLVHSHLALRMIRDLNWGGMLASTSRAVLNEMSLLGVKCGPRNYNREDATNDLLDMAEKQNYWERKRVDGQGVVAGCVS